MNECRGLPLPEPSISVGYWSHLTHPLSSLSCTQRDKPIFHSHQQILSQVKLMQFYDQLLAGHDECGEFPLLGLRAKCKPSPASVAFSAPFPEVPCDPVAAKGLFDARSAEPIAFSAFNLNSMLMWFRCQEATCFRTQAVPPAPGCHS